MIPVRDHSKRVGHVYLLFHFVNKRQPYKLATRALPSRSCVSWPLRNCLPGGVGPTTLSGNLATQRPTFAVGRRWG